MDNHSSPDTKTPDYTSRFKANLKEYTSHVGLLMIAVFIISITMCYYLVDYFLFGKNGEPFIVVILSAIACASLALCTIALISIKKPNN